MTYRRALLVLYLVLLLFGTPFASASPPRPISVNEAKIAFHLFPSPGVAVPLFNRADRTERGTLLVEMLGDDSNKIVAESSEVFTARHGNNLVRLPWDKAKMDWNPSEQSMKNPTFLGAYRLRYKVTPDAGSKFHPVQGIVQLGPHIVDGFVIQGYPSGEFICPLDCAFVVRVSDPNTGRGLAGYEVRARFGVNPGSVVTTKTGNDGYATIHYHARRSQLSGYSLWLGITARRGPYSTGWDGQLFVDIPPHLTLTTAKTTYRPGETISMKLHLTGVNGKPWAGGHVTLRLTDASRKHVLFRREITTSPTGTGQTEWTLPEDIRKLLAEPPETGRILAIRLGHRVNVPIKLLAEPARTSRIPQARPNGIPDTNLLIFAKSDDPPQGNWTAQNWTKVKVVQPKFHVHVSTNRAYYLPGQTATLMISGRDLSGKPILHGSVKLKTNWSPGFQESGDLNTSGVYVAVIHLKRIRKGLSQFSAPRFANRIMPFPIVVSVTDGSTGITESRRIVLRLAMRPILLYLRNDWVNGSDKTLRIVSSYLNGKPAEARGEVEALMPLANGNCSAASGNGHPIRLGKFQTNSYGVARFVLPGTWIDYAYPKRDDGPYSRYSSTPKLNLTDQRATRTACILLRAADRKGKKATTLTEVPVSPPTEFSTRFSTDHALYHPGEPIHVRIESDAGLKEVEGEIQTSGGEMVGAQHVRLSHGRANLTFPYNSAFRGLLNVEIYAVRGKGHPISAYSWSRNVVYPTGKKWKTGELWPADLRSPDQALHPANYRTMGYGWNIMTGFNRIPRRIDGIDRKDLLSLNPSKPFPKGLDLVAWQLLGPTELWNGWVSGYDSFSHEKFDKKNLAQIAPALRKIYQRTGTTPTDFHEFLQELKSAGVDFASLRDGWDMPYRVVFNAGAISIISNGPDKRPHTRDDYRAAEIKLP